MTLALAATLGLALAAAPDVPAASEPPRLELHDEGLRAPGPPTVHRLRAATEVATYLVLDWSLMLFTPPPSADPPGDVSVWTKLSLRGVRYDVSTYPTNFALHPLAGTIYYGSARASGVSPLEAFGWAVASSTVWELAEYPEVFSINDEIVTPVAGSALGECFFRLSSWLDRSPRSLVANGVQWVLTPMMKLDEVLDGRGAQRLAPDGTLQTTEAFSPGATRGGDGWAPDLRIALHSRLNLDTRYGRAGSQLHASADASLTEVGLEAVAARGGLASFELGARAWVATMYRSALVERPRGLSGTDLLLGVGPGYELRLHDWDRARPGPLDAFTVVHVPGLLVEGRAFSGPLRLAARFEGALSFGGTRSLALDRGELTLGDDALPSPQRAWGYHFGVGPTVASTLEARLGAVGLQTTARYDALGGITARDVGFGRHPYARLSDAQATLAARAVYHLPWSGLELSADAERRLRWSAANGTAANAAETRFSLGLGLTGDPL